MSQAPLRWLVHCTFAVSLVHAWSCSEPTANATLLSLTSLADDPLAVCNDGTPAAYYFKPGTNPSLWLVYLAGGDWCYDAASCATRAALSHVGNGGYNGTQHTSSRLFPKVCPKEGVFSEDPSGALHTANKVYIPYCTSDAHMGDRGASDSTNRWHFRGKRVVQATLDRIKREFWSSERNVTLVFGGGSAGGRGAMTLLDWVTQITPATVHVKGFLDSNMWLDVAGSNHSFMGFGAQTKAAYNYVHASSVVSNECALMYSGEEWKCIFGQFRMPFIQTPFLITASQYDSWQLRFDVCDNMAGCVIPESAMRYTDTYGMLVQQYMIGLPSVATKASSAVYSQACYNHHMSESTLFTTSLNSDGLSGNDALRQWIEHPGAYSWIDQCEGYQCSSGC